MSELLDRDELDAAAADWVFVELEHGSDLKSVVSRYVDGDAVAELGDLYGANVTEMYSAERDDATPSELIGVRETATEMFVLGFAVACHALARKARAVQP